MHSMPQHFMFLDSSRDMALALPATYDWLLVTCSVAIASLAAYAALGGAGRISAAETTFGKRSWLATGVVTMGIGV